MPRRVNMGPAPEPLAAPRPVDGGDLPAAESQAAQPAPETGSSRRGSGRIRHEEKITVYVSTEELLALEHARLALRSDRGLAVDRGRIVREAVSLALDDLEERGDESEMMKRLRGT